MKSKTRLFIARSKPDSSLPYYIVLIFARSEVEAVRNAVAGTLFGTETRCASNHHRVEVREVDPTDVVDPQKEAVRNGIFYTVFSVQTGTRVSHISRA